MLTLLQEYQGVIWWVAALSGVLFVGSLVAVPLLVVRIPEDYFLRQRRPRTPFAQHHPVLRWTALVIKNLLGAMLLAAGIAMLLLPGQGLLTIAIGVILLDFPGKHSLEGKVIRMPVVLQSINWLRRKAEAKPLKFEALEITEEERNPT